mgnify:CR=1 FL=1
MNLIGNTRIPGPVSDNYSPGNLIRKRGMRWERLFLTKGTANDPNSVLNSLTETELKTTVVLNGSTSCNKPSEGVIYEFDYSHLWNNFDDLVPYWMSIVTTDEPGNTSNSYVVAGYVSGSIGSAHQYYAGCHWDSGSGPDLRVGAGSNPTPADSGARTNLMHCCAAFLHGPDRRWDSVHAYGVTAAEAWDYTKHGTTAASFGAGDKLIKPFVALGRSNGVAGNATIGFRAYVLVGPRQSTWFPG